MKLSEAVNNDKEVRIMWALDHVDTDEMEYMTKEIKNHRRGKMFKNIKNKTIELRVNDKLVAGRGDYT
jgi:hypothetical protein